MSWSMRMASRRLCGGLCVLLLLVGCAVSGAQPVRDTSYNDTKGEGKALVADLLQRMPPENSQIMGLLKIHPPEKEVIEIPVRMTTRLLQDGWDEIYEAQPVEGKAGEVFIVKH